MRERDREREENRGFKRVPGMSKFASSLGGRVPYLVPKVARSMLASF